MDRRVERRLSSEILASSSYGPDGKSRRSVEKAAGTSIRWWQQTVRPTSTADRYTVARQPLPGPRVEHTDERPELVPVALPHRVAPVDDEEGRDL
jgi:hypothetical protein